MLLFEIMEEFLTTILMMVYVAALTVILHKIKSFMKKGNTTHHDIEYTTHSIRTYPIFTFDI